MKAKILTLALALGALAPVATAEPTGPAILTEVQMDGVTAGRADVLDLPGFVLHLQEWVKEVVGSGNPTVGQENIIRQEKRVVVVGSGNATVDQHVAQND